MFFKIRIKLLVLVLPIIILSMFASYVVSSSVSRTILDNEINDRIVTQQQLQASEIENKLNTARSISDDLASFVTHTYHEETLANYESLLESVIQDDPFILGAGIWFEPYAYLSPIKYAGPYVYKTGGTIKATYEYSNVYYDYFSQPYYTLAKEEGSVIFTEPYYDSISGLYMITCSHPIYDNGNFIGCATVDVRLSRLQELMSSYTNDTHAQLFIIEEDGRVIAENTNSTPEMERYLSELDAKIFTLLPDQDYLSYQDQSNNSYRIYYDALESLDWDLFYVLPEDSIRAPIKSLFYSFAVICILTILFISLVIIIIVSLNINRPIRGLNEEFEKIGNNSYSTELTKVLVNRKDEFGVLGHSLQNMKKQLKSYQTRLEDSLEENIAFGEEITEQNDILTSNEEKLMKALQYNASMLAAIPDAVLLLSKDGRVIDILGATNVHNINYLEFKGRYLFEFLRQDISSAAMTLIHNVSIHGTVEILEYYLDLGHGREYFEARVSKCFDDKVLAVSRSVTENKNHLQEIEFLSYHDQVTGLHNRRYYDMTLSNLLRNRQFPISIVISDVNGLKVINDSFGHDHGDILLQKFANILKNSDVDMQYIARTGGDEFIVLLPGYNELQTEEYLRNLAEECNKEVINGISISVSFGFSTIHNEQDSAQTLIKQAEDQMYQNKMLEAPSRKSKIVDIIISTLQSKNPREQFHSDRVADLCEAMAYSLELPQSIVLKTRSAALLHDIGKIGIPETLLNKPGYLTEDEYTTIKKHPEIGYRILQSSSDLSDISEIILSHHERWDGTGYPRSLYGEEIPYISRMISIADSYDAMTSDRSYRNAIDEKTAAEEILRCAGTQFDPELAAYFVHSVLKLK
ncbi:MAG: HD domain-containing phosphohydrolase [Lachnospiraceae bacterium]